MEINRKHIHDLGKNLLVCAAYIPDITSPYFNENTPMLATGDLNGKTGLLDDIFQLTLVAGK